MKTLRRNQTKVRDAHRGLRLVGSVEGARKSRVPVISPYFQMTDLRKEAPTRDISFISVYMAVNKAIAIAYLPYNNDLGVDTQFYDGNTCVFEYNIELSDTSQYTSQSAVQAYANSLILAKAASQGYTGLTSDSQILWAAIPTTSTRTFNYPSLAVNTARQASATQDASVTASVDITTTLSLTGGTTGKVTLQYADNNTFTTNLVSVSEYTNSNTGTLTVGLNISQIGTAVVTGIIPAGKYYRLLTTSATGTPTYGTPSVQEVLI